MAAPSHAISTSAVLNISSRELELTIWPSLMQREERTDEHRVRSPLSDSLTGLYWSDFLEDCYWLRAQEWSSNDKQSTNWWIPLPIQVKSRPGRFTSHVSYVVLRGKSRYFKVTFHQAKLTSIWQCLGTTDCVASVFLSQASLYSTLASSISAWCDVCVSLSSTSHHYKLQIPVSSLNTSLQSSRPVVCRVGGDVVMLFWVWPLWVRCCVAKYSLQTRSDYSAGQPTPDCSALCVSTLVSWHYCHLLPASTDHTDHHQLHHTHRQA